MAVEIAFGSDEVSEGAADVFYRFIERYSVECDLPKADGTREESELWPRCGALIQFAFAVHFKRDETADVREHDFC